MKNKHIPDRLEICIVASRCCTAIGGQEIYNRQLGDFLSLNHDVVGISRYKNKKKPGVFEFDEFEESDPILRENWKIHYIRPRGILKPLLARLNSLYTRPNFHKIALMILRSAYGQGIRNILSEKIDVVHYIGAGRDALSDVALSEGRKKGALIAVTPSTHPGAWADSQLDIDFYNRVDIVFALSEYEKKYLNSKGVKSDIITVYHAPGFTEVGDGEYFRSKHGIDKKKIVLFVGRKQKYKGYHTLCTVMKEIIKEFPDAILVSIGPDTEPPYPIIGKENHLDLGRVSDQDKAHAFAAADIFCMPSDAEAFGITYIEAWANGLPVISGSAPAVKELVEHGVNGYSIENQDNHDLYKYLKILLIDDLHRKNLGMAGKLMVSNKYNWNKIAELYVDAYTSKMKVLISR
ncbi:glycosyltransferase family 4 protein [Armatimonas sp.]|uniref:glycosyltransferase family 4 protein n=1 Tax=Armatimonas sp. TaxID=1872638 RepID=UPI00286C143A|nr:glycosyltransferase family 4 protein [Armatimonas sp.]